MTVVFQWKPEDMEALLAACERNEVGALAQRHFPPGGRVLEAGCGVGQWVRWLGARGFRATGVEIAPETVAMARAHWKDLDLQVGDVARMTFEAGAFDAALSLGVVEHWPEGPRAPLAELLRVLRPGGIALITVPCLNGIREWKRRLWIDEAWGALRAARNLALRRGGGRTCFRLHREYRYAVFPGVGSFFEYRMRPAEFRAEVERAGFEVVEHGPTAVIDGLYHELNPFGLLVGFRDWKFSPSPLGAALNTWLARAPFRSPHMQVIVARRPAR